MSGQPSSQLFTVRIWRAGEGQSPAWYGKVQALPGGEAYYFRAWPQLVQLLVGMLGTDASAACDDLSPDDCGAAASQACE